MNDILTALFVTACVAGTGLVVVRSNNTILSNLGVIIMASGVIVAFGLLIALVVGMFIIILQVLAGGA